MITNLKLKNFKSHKETLLELKNLTVFCGTNGVGKSSAIQSLLLLREAFLANSNFEYLDLKCNPVTIGTAKDALYQFSDNNAVSFSIQTDKQNFDFSFFSKDVDLTKSLMHKAPDANHSFERKDLEIESLFNKQTQFISAARLGPQISYPKDDVVVDVYNQISVIDGKAEHFLHFLQKNAENDVLTEMRNASESYSDLFRQTMAWEREISKGIRIIIEDKGNLGYELKYEFSTGDGKTDQFRAGNVGFGVTYVMPIIVAILSAAPDTLLLIENPEAHLHPNGQARLAELICLAAQAGVQIVIETHSDHIINGILVQCKKFEESSKGINREKVSIYQFDRDENEHSTVAVRINIEENGVIRYAPGGFFDQFSIDRKFLLGF